MRVAIKESVTVECRCFAHNYFIFILKKSLNKLLSIIQISRALLILYLSIAPFQYNYYYYCYYLCLKNDADCRHRDATDWHYVSYDWCLLLASYWTVLQRQWLLSRLYVSSYRRPHEHHQPNNKFIIMWAAFVLFYSIDQYCSQAAGGRCVNEFP